MSRISLNNHWITISFKDRSCGHQSKDCEKNDASTPHAASPIPMHRRPQKKKHALESPKSSSHASADFGDVRPIPWIKSRLKHVKTAEISAPQNSLAQKVCGFCTVISNGSKSRIMDCFIFRRRWISPESHKWQCLQFAPRRWKQFQTTTLHSDHFWNGYIP